MAAALIHCRVRGTPPLEEIWLSVAGILRADPETDPAGSYVRITPTDADRPSFGVLPPTGPATPDAMAVIVWWLTVAAQVGTAHGAL